MQGKRDWGRKAEQHGVEWTTPSSRKHRSPGKQALEQESEGGRRWLGGDRAYEPHQASLQGRESRAGGLLFLDPWGTTVV